MVEYHLDSATNALNRILNSLDEKSDIYDHTKNVKLILESPLFINLYNIQKTLKSYQLDDDDDYFKTIKLERSTSLQTFGFTIILVQHPEAEIGETFVFIQDVDENSIAANANLEPIDQILAVNEHYLDKNGFQLAFNELISNRLNIVELLVKKNELIKKSVNKDNLLINDNYQMTFRDMVLNTEWTQIEVLHLENDFQNGFGFGITGNKSTGVVVKSITPGSPADRNKNLQVGDHLFQIGEINVRSMSSEQIASIIRQTTQLKNGQMIKFIVARPIRQPVNSKIDTESLLNSNTETKKIIETKQINDMKNLIQNLSNVINVDDNDVDLIKLSNSPKQQQIQINNECNLERNDCSKTFGVSITSIDGSIFYVNNISKDSIADKTKKINIYDEIVEINEETIKDEEEAIIILNSELKIKLKLKCDINRIKEFLIVKWSNKLEKEKEEIIVDFIDKTSTTCLGISLEGTVDIENGKEIRSHHFIRSILKDGPIYKSKNFKEGDELLEINGHVLYNISYIELLNILKYLPMKMLVLVCFRVKNMKKEEATSVKGLKENRFIIPPGRTPPIRSRSLELNGLAMWNIKINYIELNKTERGLGFSIIDYKDQNNSNNNAIVIRSLVPNGVAQIDGRLLPGYRLVSVNNTNLENSSLDFAVKCLKEAPKGVVKLGVQKPLPFPYTMNDLDNKTKSEACMLSKVKNKLVEDDLFDDKINETIKLLNDIKTSEEDEEEDDGGFIATSAPAMLINNDDYRIHYQINNTNNNLENIIDDDGSDLDDFFSNINSNYPDNNDDEDDDYDDNLTDTTNTSCASSNSIKSSLINVPTIVKEVNSNEEKIEDEREEEEELSLVIKNNFEIDVDFDKHEYGEFVYSYENIRYNLNSNRSSITGMNIASTTSSNNKIFTAEIVKNDQDLMMKSMSNSISSLHSHKSYSASTNSSSYAQKINILGIEIIQLPSILEKEIRIKKIFEASNIGLVVDSNYEEGVNGCLIKEIKENSVIKSDNRLRVGDYIQSLNNENMKKITNSTAKSILKRASLVSNDIIIKYIPMIDAICFKDNLELKSTLTSTHTSTSSLIQNQTTSPIKHHHIPNDDNKKIDEELVNEIIIENNEQHHHHLTLSSSSSTQLDLSTNANDLIASSLWGPLRTISLEREPGKSVGISIVGGKLDVFGGSSSNSSDSTTATTSENFISGIFIKHVLENSPAGLNGTLKTGDRILKVNEFDLTNATHDKAVDVIRNAKSPIVFVIQSLLCANNNINDNINLHEEFENKFDENNKYGYNLEDLKEKYNYLEGDLFIVQLKRKNSNESLGLSLSGNINLTKASVFICDIYQDSISHKHGFLKLGDQIIEINGQILYGRAHSNVTPFIRSIKDLDVFLVILRNNGSLDEMFKPSLTKLNEVKKNQNNNFMQAQDLTLSIDIQSMSDDQNNNKMRNSLSSSSSSNTNNNNNNNNHLGEYKTLNVTLTKGPTGFGIAISENRQGKLIIRGINVNGVAYQDGNLKVGDEIIAVNNVNVNTMKYEDVMQLLHDSTQPVEFRVISGVFTDSPISVSSSNPSPQEQTLKKPKNIEKSPTTPPPLQIFNPKTAKIKVCEETLIEIERGKLGLGLSIVGGCDTQLHAIIIHDIYENGAAFKDKRLHIGDQILKVNTIDLKNVTHDEALNILRRQTTEYIQMLIYRNYETLDDEEDKFDVFQVDLYKKFGKGLGVSIIGRRDGFGVFISHIIEGGCAAKDGRLMIGDLILEVNDKDIRKAPYNEVAFILKTLPPQTKVTLKIGRLKSNISSRKNSFTATTTPPTSKTTTNHVEIIKK